MYTFPEFDSTPLDGVGMGVGEFLRRKILRVEHRVKRREGGFLGGEKHKKKKKKGENKKWAGL
jgi:hypothetical protein